MSQPMGIAVVEAHRWDRAGVFVGTARRPAHGLGSTGAEQEGLREGSVPELCLASCAIPPRESSLWRSDAP